MESVQLKDEPLLPLVANGNETNDAHYNHFNFNVKHEHSSTGLEDRAGYDEEHSEASDCEGGKLSQHKADNGVAQGEPSEDDEDLDNGAVPGGGESLSDGHENPDQLLICFECGETFDDKESLQLHVKSHNLPFKCSVCGDGFNDRDSLIQHAEIHAADKSVSNMPFGFEYYRSKEKSKTPKKPKRKYTRNSFDPNAKECPICHKVFSTVYVMKNHMEIHTGIKDHKCNICGKSFSAKRYLAKHIDTHSDEKPYKCSVCEKAFRTAYYLRVHTRLHTGDLPFGCQVCGKSFNVITELKVHMRNHTGEKPFKCSVCDMAFAAGSYLRTHMRIHTGEKPFECRLCGRRFGRSNGLKTHMATHTNYRPHMCHICDKGFARPDELKSHVFRIHKGKKPDRIQNSNSLLADGFDRTLTGWEYNRTLDSDGLDRKKSKRKSKRLSEGLGKKMTNYNEDAYNNFDTFDRKATEQDDYINATEEENNLNVNSDDLVREMTDEEENTRGSSEWQGNSVSVNSTEREENTRGSSDGLDKELTEEEGVVIKNGEREMFGEGVDVKHGEREMFGEGACDLETESLGIEAADMTKLSDSAQTTDEGTSSNDKSIVKCHICGTLIDEVRDLLVTAAGEKLLECSVCKTISDQRPLNVLGIDLAKLNSIKEEEKQTPARPGPGRRKKKRSNRCPICEREFAPTYLKVHMEIHSGLKPYKCGVCGKMFNARRYLTKHLETHKEVKKYRCGICDKTFGSKYYLKIHTSVHTGQKAFSCDICGKQFNIRPDLNTHMRIHTGEKPFACSLCDRAFISSAYLRSHMKIHTGEKNHECPMCDKKFSRSNDLKIHITTHTGEKPYKCLKCGKGFNRSGEIDAHMKNFHATDYYNYFHNGETETSSDGIVSLEVTSKKFEADELICNICGKAFGRKVHLKAHLRTHTGERPYSCYVCHKTFPENGKLKRHLKVHEREVSVSGECLDQMESSHLEMEYDHFDYRLHLTDSTQNMFPSSTPQLSPDSTLPLATTSFPVTQG